MLLGIKQVLINIDEDKYEHICQKVRKAKNEDRYVHYEWEIIANGIVLPKGHGRLIDADAFIAMMNDASKRQKYKELLIDDRLTVDDVFEAVIASMLNQGFAEGDAPTIIEADREV